MAPKINPKGKVGDLKQQYIQNLIQSKSTNFSYQNMLNLKRA